MNNEKKYVDTRGIQLNEKLSLNAILTEMTKNSKIKNGIIRIAPISLTGIALGTGCKYHE